METMERKEGLEKLLDGDEIYRAYADSVRELEDAYERVVRSLPPEQQRVLTGYRQCRELMDLRAREIICQNMQFCEK